YVADTYLTGAVLEFPAGCHNCTPVDLGGNNSDYQVFRQPTAVALDGAGNIYVADFGDAAVKAMPPGCASSSCVTTLGGGFNQPYGVAVDGSGNVYVADSGNNTVKEIPPGCVSSNCVATLGGSFSEVTAVVVDGSGNVYVGDDGAVKEMPPGCSSVSCVTTVGSGFFTGTPLAVDGTGNLYASDGTVVKELPSGCASSNCVITLAGGSTKFYILTGLAVDGSGNVYVEDFYANRIYEWNLATVPSLSFADAKVGLQSGDSPQTVTLRNIGNAPLMFPAPGSGENPGVSPNFALDASTTCPEVTSSPSAGMLAAGASCNLAVDFIPTTSGPLTGPAVLTDNNLNVTDATQSMGLTGTGLATIITPTVTVTPYSSSVLTDEAASVQAVVSTGSGNPTPTGSVTLTSGSYTSAATTLTGGSANIYVPAGSLAAGNDTLTVTYTPDSTSSSTYTTATGTAPLTVTQAIGPCQLVGVNPNPNPESFNAPHDFNGDCKSDVLWRNSATGEVEIWFMNGTTFAGSASLGHVSSAWVIQDVDDFNADGYADILWRNTTTGEVYLWFMNGAMSVGGGSLGSVSSDWRIAGVGDFNGDGSADILWQNNSGELYLWLMNGTTIAGGGIVGNASSGWNVAGIGDFNGDGKADILWRNSTTGEVYLWFMNGSTMTGTLSPGSPTPDWVITAVGDFDLNGMSDILWRNTTTGQVYVWYTYDQGSEVEGGSLDYGLNYVSSDWVIQSVGNYDGGAGGILWRNRTTGEVNIWLDNENASGSPGTPNNTWQIAP
ncbi:MAG: FG-GAP-like repeat-containing protein, partial [Acidobacteriaceae bacterium]